MRLLAFVLLLTVLAALATGCFRYYRWESQKEKPGQADVMIVPGLQLTRDGKGTYILHNRVAMAKHLLEEGYASKLLLSGGKPRSGVTEAEKMKQIALEMGVPAGKISVESRATSSVENAEYSAEQMVSGGYRSALLVSDAQHLGYAIPVFRDAFEEHKLTLYWLPVDYDLITKLGTARHPGDPPQ